MRYIDFHCDTFLKLYEEDKELFKNDCSVDIEKLLKGDCLAQYFAVFIDTNYNKSPFDKANKVIDKFYLELNKNIDYIKLGTNYSSITENISSNKISAFLTLEEGECLEGNLDNLSFFYSRGVRLITLTWNYENAIGYPGVLNNLNKNGLKIFGKELVEAMNSYKMLIDVSHLNDGGFYDVINGSKYPIIASHSNSRYITPHTRNLDDDMIKKLANKGGLMGLNFASFFMGESNVTKIDDMIKHILHIKNVGGIDVLALGSDFDGIPNKVEINNSSEMNKLSIALKGILTEAEIEKIYYKNALRIIKDVL